MKLGVNIDHVATLRQARGGFEPDTVRAARVCQRSGAHAVVMHLREDRRHVQDADLFRVRKAVSIKLNLEMSVAPGIVRIAERLKPDQVTLVPERREERTTESGLNLYGRERAIRSCIERCRKKKIIVSLFIDPDPRQIDQASAFGADAVEFHTGTYAGACLAGRQAPEGIRRRELKRLSGAVALARSVGLITHAGHGLDYENVKAVRRIDGIEELNIGYSIVTRALWVGLDRAVSQMVRMIQ